MKYSVRVADYNDLPWILDDAGVRMIQEEVKQPELYNRATMTNIVIAAIEQETVFIGTADDKPVGVIGGIIVPHYLNADKTTLAEIMWYVYPEYRETRVGIFMLKKYSERAKDFDYATFSLLADSPIADRTLERYGFMPKERSFLMEN